MKKLLAIILALALLTALFAGCGAAASSEAASASQEASVAEVSEAEAPAEEQAEPAPAEEAVEPSAAEEAASVEEAEEAEEPQEVVYENVADKYMAESVETNAHYYEMVEGVEPATEYPLSDGSETVSIYHTFSAFIWGDLAASYSDFAIMPAVEEATGVSLEFVEVSDSAASEQFNLLIASGDTPDLMGMNSYSGKAVSALEDDVIYDLTDMVAEDMPYYAALVDTMDDYTKKTLYTSDDSILEIYTLASNVIGEQGLSYRSDWAEEVGITEIATIDDLYDYLMAVNEIYDCTYPIFIDGSAVLEGFTGAFGTPGITLESTDLGMKMDGDTVVATIADETFRNYVENFNRFYSSGLIKDDFYSESYGPDYINAYIIDDKCAVSTIRSDKFTTLQESASAPDFKFEALAPLTSEGIDEYAFNQKRSMVGNGSYSITTNCEDPELVCRFVDWFFSPNAYMLNNYGEEGVSFEYNEDGNPVYTDLIVNNPDGYNTMSIRNFYTQPLFPFYQNAVSLFYSYDEVELSAFDMWNNNGTDACSMPTLNLTTDESSEYADYASTIYTYASEQILKWMIGEEELTDDSWNTYVEQCEAMGLADAVAIYQNVYDRMYK